MTMRTIMQKLLAGARRYYLNAAGSIAILAGITAPVVIGAAGMALDMSQAYLVQERLRNALDAAALAAANLNLQGEAAVKAKVLDFLRQNYPDHAIGNLDYNSVDVDIHGDDIIVSANAHYATTFLRVLDIDDIEVYSRTGVRREIQGIEVVLVLDNTGSMSYDNNIEKLKTAARNFVNILYTSAPNPATIKVAIVPYSQAVNVGPYGLGKNPDGSYYGPAFVNNPNNLSYTTNRSSQQWYGCVEADLDFDLDTSDHEGNWNMYRWKDLNKQCVQWNQWGSCTRRDYVHNTNGGGPNTSCPPPLLPLTNNRTKIENAISAMRTDGNTHGNLGMVWGYRVISPEFPFEEGVGYDNVYWRKVIVMMTDGQNTIGNSYSAYGANDAMNDPGYEQYAHGITPYDLNERFEETCEQVKDNDIDVYTITFANNTSFPESIKDYYRYCASEVSKYHHVDNANDLIDVFEQISRELGNIHIRS